MMKKSSEYNVKCPFCGALENERCFTLFSAYTGNMGKHIRKEPHKKRIEAAKKLAVEKEAKQMADYCQYEKIIVPLYLKELIQYAAKHTKNSVDKGELLQITKLLARSVAMDEDTYIYAHPIELLFKEWVEEI